MILSSKG